MFRPTEGKTSLALHVSRRCPFAARKRRIQDKRTRRSGYKPHGARISNGAELLPVHDDGIADLNDVIKRRRRIRRQVDASMASIGLIGLGVAENGRRLPWSIVEAHHVPHERHPVINGRIPFGLVRLGVDRTSQRNILLQVLQVVHARRGVIFSVRLSRDDRSIPQQVSRSVVIIRMLLREVDVTIRPPILTCLRIAIASRRARRPPWH